MEYKDPPVTYLCHWVEKYCKQCNIPDRLWYSSGEVRGRFWYWLKDNADGAAIRPSFSECEKHDYHGDSIDE